MGLFFTLFFIFIGILLVLFIGYTLNHNKNHDDGGHAKCCECGCVPEVTLYTEDIWGKHHYCLKCADKIGNKKKYIDFHINQEDESLI